MVHIVYRQLQRVVSTKALKPFFRLLRLFHIAFVVQRDIFAIELFRRLRYLLYLDVSNGFRDLLNYFIAKKSLTTLICSITFFVVVGGREEITLINKATFVTMLQIGYLMFSLIICKTVYK